MVRGSASFARSALFGVEPREQRLGRHRHRDHLAPFLGGPDRVDLHARRRLREQAHVVVRLLRVRQLVGRARDVAEHRLRRGHGLRGGQVVHHRRQEEGLGRVLPDLLRVLLVDRLHRVPARFRRREGGAGGLRGSALRVARIGGQQGCEGDEQADDDRSRAEAAHRRPRGGGRDRVPGVQYIRTSRFDPALHIHRCTGAHRSSLLSTIAASPSKGRGRPRKRRVRFRGRRCPGTRYNGS